MALPKITYPTFTTRVPSTGDIVKYRPFNSGEEKILLTAVESEDSVDIVNATKQIIENCFSGINIDSLTSYDIDYMFLQLRIKSVSPISELYFRNQSCEKNDYNPCEKSVRININLEDVEVSRYDEKTESYVPINTTEKIETKIQLTDSIGAIMKHPGFKEKEEIAKFGDDADEDDWVKVCIVSIYDDESVYTREDFTEDELDEFYDSLQTPSKNLLKEFLRNAPKVRYESKFVCKECGYTEDIILEDLESFFV